MYEVLENINFEKIKLKRLFCETKCRAGAAAIFIRISACGKEVKSLFIQHSDCQKMNINLILCCQAPSYVGSVTQASTVSLGRGVDGAEVFIPLGKLLPMVDPTNLELDGWDISNRDLASAMQAAEVLDYDLQRQLVPMMENMVRMTRGFVCLSLFILGCVKSCNCRNV